jgi:hypothetical protein
MKNSEQIIKDLFVGYEVNFVNALAGPVAWKKLSDPVAIKMNKIIIASEHSPIVAESITAATSINTSGLLN